MGPLGWPEIIGLLFLLLILFGAKRLPELGRSLGQGMREFKRSVTGLTEDLSVDEPAPRPAAKKEEPPEKAA